LVDALAAEGHEITVVAPFPSFPHGRFDRGDRGKLGRIERRDGVRVVRLGSLLPHGMPAARLVHWASCALAAALYLTFTRARYDLVIASMPPITLAVPALLAAWRHRSRLVVDVRDVFPDIAIAMGEWRADGLLARTSEWLVRKLYRRADLIVAVTPTAIAAIATRGVDPARLILARNAAEEIPACVRSSQSPRGFTAVYAGNLGLATDLDVLIDAAALVASDGITIEIVGDGAQRAHLENRLRRERIANVTIAGSLPRSAAMQRLADADVAIVPLRRGIEESVPTKLYDAISVGCPVIVAAGGEARIEGAALGAICTPPGDAPGLADALRALHALEPDALRALGNEGRARVSARAGRAGIMMELSGRISRLAPAV
jgi:glycosyltransferase involved in cell wall biosynthesis